jgi:hypothetical protein
MQSRANDRFRTTTLPQDPAGLDGRFATEPADITDVPVDALDTGAVNPGIAGNRIPFQLTHPFGTVEFCEFGTGISADEVCVEFDIGTVRPGMLGNTIPP